MDPTLKITIAAALGAIVGSIITAMVAPQINWGIEKKREKLAYRRALIASWREMLSHAVYFVDEETPEQIKERVEGHKDFYSLKPHLSQSTLSELARPRTFTVGLTIPTAIDNMITEIAEIERKWDLI
jgi:predicted aconitase